MVIVLVRWFIQPDQRPAFKRWWRDEAIPLDTSGLMAEFLSEPVPEQEIVQYKTDDLQPESHDFVQIVNVGLWKDEATFRAVIKPNDDRDLMDFETRLPIRTVLTPRDLHSGTWYPGLEGFPLPSESPAE